MSRDWDSPIPHICLEGSQWFKFTVSVHVGLDQRDTDQRGVCVLSVSSASQGALGGDKAQMWKVLILVQLQHFQGLRSSS